MAYGIKNNQQIDEEKAVADQEDTDREEAIGSVHENAKPVSPLAAHCRK